jgi:hypothetical protein
MSTSSHPRSATIYQFPRKIPANAGECHRAVKATAALGMQAIPTVEFGSGWYHEAAVQAERARKP